MRFLKRNLEEKSHLLDKFLSKVAFELVYTPADINSANYPDIRDKGDYAI